jgi:hypothetical protein
MSEIGTGTVGAKKAGSRRAGKAASGPVENGNGAVAGAGAGKPGEEPENGKTESQPNAAAEPEKKEPEKRERGNGLKRLQKAADKRLASASEALADLLLKKAKEGRVDSTRLLVTLAERKKERKPQEKKKKKRGLLPWVEQLCSEPEFKQPEVGDVWVGDGWRKQTGEIVKEREWVDEWMQEPGTKDGF